MIIDNKGVAFLSFLIGIPLLIFGSIFLIQGFTDYLLIILTIVIGGLLVLGGILTIRNYISEQKKIL